MVLGSGNRVCPHGLYFGLCLYILPVHGVSPWGTPAPEQAGEGLHEMGKGGVRAAIASEGYLSDVEVRLHNVHMHD